MHYALYLYLYYCHTLLSLEKSTSSGCFYYTIFYILYVNIISVTLLTSLAFASVGMWMQPLTLVF